jgi:transposase
LPDSQAREVLKAFRRIATRYEKTDTCFAAMINIVADVLWTR